MEICQPLRIAPILQGGAQIEGQHVVLVEAAVDGDQLEVAAQQQRGAHHQHHRHGDLADHQGRATTLPGADRPGPGGTQRVDELVAAGMERRG